MAFSNPITLTLGTPTPRGQAKRDCLKASESVSVPEQPHSGQLLTHTHTPPEAELVGKHTGQEAPTSC